MASELPNGSPGGLSSSVNANGVVVGGTLGFNYQFNAFVVGVEGDFDYSGINGSTVCGATGNCQTGNTWLGTIRGRFGFAADRVLFYGTAGGVFGNEKLTNAGVTNTDTQVGWTVGAGVEAAFADTGPQKSNTSTLIWAPRHARRRVEASRSPSA